MVESYLINCIGKVVVSSTAGGGAGGILLIQFCNDDCLWAYAYWELYKGDELLATICDDISAITGKVAVAANSLRGETVKSIFVSENLDLMVCFSNGYYLKVFNSFSDGEEDLCNWEYWMPNIDRCYTVNSMLQLEVSNYY